MKRSRRKQDSKVEDSSQLPGKAEKPAGGLPARASTADFAAVADDSDTLAPNTDSVVPMGGSEGSAAVAASPLPTDSAGAVATAADRRTHPRYEFVAAVEIEDAESGTRIETRIRDLSKQGCYVDTESPFSLGIVTNVRIRKGANTFLARARVVFSRVGKGMGLFFTKIDPEQRGTLETWLAESRETSWLAANRRRSQRVLMRVPVRVSGKTDIGLLFEQETQTLAISAHGALVLAPIEVYRGQHLTLSNIQTKSSLECVVAHVAKRRGEPAQMGIEFMLPNPVFWHVAFPPKDWSPRHPDAKSRPKSGGSRD